MKTCQFKIVHEFKLIILHFAGEVGFSDLVTLNSQLNAQKDHNPTYNYLAVINEVEFTLSMEQINSFLSYLYSQANANSKILVSVLVSKQKATAIAYIFQSLSNHLILDIEVFTGLQAALQHLGIHPSNQVEIEKTISELN